MCSDSAGRSCGSPSVGPYMAARLPAMASNSARRTSAISSQSAGRTKNDASGGTRWRNHVPETLAAVKKILGKFAKNKPALETATETAHIRKDLGVSSANLVDVLLEFEEAFD